MYSWLGLIVRLVTVYVSEGKLGDSMQRRFTLIQMLAGTYRDQEAARLPCPVREQIADTFEFCFLSV